MLKLAYEEYAEKFLNQLPKGAFLTVKDGDHLNTMTIGWGSLGFMWQKPVLIVMVRYSRHTYDLIEKAQDFSVSLPAGDELKQALAIAGSKSGREINKFEACKLTPQKAHNIESPVIGECGLVFECRLVYKQAMEADKLDAKIQEKFYSDNNYHVIYYGEIVDCYQQ